MNTPKMMVWNMYLLSYLAVFDINSLNPRECILQQTAGAACRRIFSSGRHVCWDDVRLQELSGATHEDLETTDLQVSGVAGCRCVAFYDKVTTFPRKFNE